MKPRIITLLTLLLFSIGIFAACGPTTGPVNTDPVETITDLKVPDNFNWKTHRDHTFRLTGYQTGLVRFVDENGIEYHRANLIQGQEYSFNLAVPAYMNRISVAFSNQEKKVNLDRQVISLSFQQSNS